MVNEPIDKATLESWTAIRKLVLIFGLCLMFGPLACDTGPAKTKLQATSQADTPIIEALIPDHARPGGGDVVLLTGKNFNDDVTVLLGAEECEISVLSETEIRVIVPSTSKLGQSVDVVVEFGEDAELRRGVKHGGFAYEGLSKQTVVIIGAVIVLLALLGLPLFLVIGVATALGYFLTAQEDSLGFFMSISPTGQERAGLGSTIFNWVTDMGGKPLFIAIPLFTFAGSLMSESGAPTRLVNVARSLVGWFPGGLAWVTLLVCCFFTAFTGASGVTIIALGGLLFPILTKEGYSENYSLGLLTTGGSLGLLIPPSLPVIVYGIIAGLDADRIWDAGIGPMILIVLLLGGHAMIVATASGVPRHATSFKEITDAIKAAAFELPLPFIVVIGIKGGYVTATEASAVTAFWVLIVEVFVYKDIKVKELPGVIQRSMVLVGGLIIIIGLALAFTTYLTKNEVPQRILALMQQRIDNQLTFLLMLNVFLLIVGCLMDIFSAILVVVPLIAPVAIGFGVDPFHLAIIFLVNLEIGYSTPPVGINLFISSMRFERPVFQLYRASIVFIFVLLIGLGIITYIPALTLGRFELPEVQIVDDEGQVISQPLVVTEGDDKTLKVKGSVAGLSLKQAFEQEQAARKALSDLEAKLSLSYGKLSSEILTLENKVTAGKGTSQDLSGVQNKILELKKQREPLVKVAKAYERKQQKRLVVENLQKTATWRCRLHPDFEETGAELDLSELEVGEYRLSLTGFTDKKHLAQTLLTVTVKPDPENSGDDDDDEDD